MPTSIGAIQKFLLERPPSPPLAFRQAERDVLLDKIYWVGQHKLLSRTPPYLHQLQGLAFALWAERSLLFYEMRSGKAVELNCPVSTPDGWRPIGELKVGDLVMSPSGKPTRVTGVFPQGLRELYRVTFTDDAETICDKEHLWTVQTAIGKWRGDPPRTLTLAQIEESGLQLTKGQGYRWFIPLTEAVQYETKLLPIDPYTLGAILGDGGITHAARIYTDEEIIDRLILPEGAMVRKVPARSDKIMIGHLSGIRDALRELELLGCKAEQKFIPDPYLFGSIEQRFALLQGLMDTDGYVQRLPRGVNTVFSSSSSQLALDVQELVRSLGGTARITVKEQPTYTHQREKRTGLPHYKMVVRLPPSLGCPFRLQRKAVDWQPFTKFLPTRAIKSIKYVEKAPAVCISVDSTDGLFVIKDYVVTHNTLIALDFISYLVYSGLLTKKALIIAHAPIGVDEWENQAGVHSHIDVMAIRSGSNAVDRFFYALDNPQCDAVLISWSTLQTIFSIKRPMRTNKTRDKHYADLPVLREVARCFDCLVIDEIHMAANWESLRFAIAKEIGAYCRWRLGLTGTPFGRDPLLLWGESFLIDGGRALTPSFPFFREAFCTRKTARFKRWNPFEFVFDQKKMPLLQDKLRALTLHCRLTDIQEINVLRGVVKLKMSAEQRKAYDEAIDHLVELKTGDTVEIDATFVRLRQIASGFLPFDDSDGVRRVIDFPDAAKLLWLDDFLGNLPDLQICIMHEFIHSGELICRLLEERRIKFDWLRGGTKERPQLQQRFKSGATQILLSNTGTGGMAIDLSAADYLLFYESTPSVITRRQAEARPLARGSRPLVIDDLVCAPVEKRLLEFLAQGDNLREALRRNPRDLAGEFRG